MFGQIFNLFWQTSFGLLRTFSLSEMTKFKKTILPSGHTDCDTKSNKENRASKLTFECTMVCTKIGGFKGQTETESGQQPV